MSKARAIVEALMAGGMSKTDIAKAIGYDRSSVSRWINEPGYNGAFIEAAVLATLQRRICPHDGQEKKVAQCERIALRPQPHGFPDAEAIWKTCQTCDLKPMPKEVKPAPDKKAKKTRKGSEK